jgi:hypothetical protein
MASWFLAALLAAAPAAGSPTACGGGIEASLGTSSPSQGGVSLLEITAPASAGDVGVTWEGKPVPVWRESPAGPLRALLGVDVERKPGSVALVVTPEGKPPCALAVEVKAGEFVVKELRVPDRYVELNPHDLERAQKEAARLEAVFSTAGPDRLWTGPFRLPLRGLPPSDNFGQHRVLNGEPRSFHTGVDFPAASGTPVRAAQKGRVALAEPLFFSGRTVVVDHGLGLYSFYGHLSAIAVTAGQAVAEGAIIGRVGATGRATGPHLHWSVRLNGARVNPLALVAALREETRPR